MLQDFKLIVFSRTKPYTKKILSCIFDLFSRRVTLFRLCHVSCRITYDTHTRTYAYVKYVIFFLAKLLEPFERAKWSLVSSRSSIERRPEIDQEQKFEINELKPVQAPSLKEKRKICVINGRARLHSDRLTSLTLYASQRERPRKYTLHEVTERTSTCN